MLIASRAAFRRGGARRARVARSASGRLRGGVLMSARTVETEAQRAPPQVVDAVLAQQATPNAQGDKRVLRIFVSHNTDHEPIATALRVSLQALESKYELAVMLCEDMPGSTEWERWIRESVRGAHLFLLLYPQENTEMT